MRIRTHLKSSSKFERTGSRAFSRTCVKSVTIPDSVIVEQGCFYLCDSLQCVHLGKQSKLKRIGPRYFWWTHVESVTIPDSVVELEEECFSDCLSLRCVQFGKQSKLESRHSGGRVLSPSQFQTVLLNLNRSALPGVVVFGALLSGQPPSWSGSDGRPLMGQTLRHITSKTCYRNVQTSLV